MLAGQLADASPCRTGSIGGNMTKNKEITEEYAVLSDKKWIVKAFSFLKFLYLDKREKRRRRKAGIIEFEEYGLTCFVGRQGDGKTISMLEMAEYYRMKYPGTRFASNFGYVHEDFPITSWSDITEHDFKSEPVGMIFFMPNLAPGIRKTFLNVR